MVHSLSLAMQRYSVQRRHRIFLKDYRFLSFARNMGKNVAKNISKNLGSNYSQKPLHHDKKSAINALKTASKRAIQKTAEATADLIGNKIADKFPRVSKTSPKNRSETNKEEILRERFITLELRQNIINDMRIKTKNYWWSKIWNYLMI